MTAHTKARSTLYIFLTSLIISVSPLAHSAGLLSYRDSGFSTGDLDDTSLAVRSAGYPCEKLIKAENVYEDGTKLPVMKLTCDNGGFGVKEFQATIINQEVHIKIWTGSIIGF